MSVLLLQPAAAQTFDAGPLRLDVITNGDPLHIEYDDGKTPTDVGDDELDLFQSVRLIGVGLSTGWPKQAGLPLPPSGEMRQSFNFEETTVEHPVFTVANDTDEEVYDRSAPGPIRETANVEYHEYTYKADLNINTPVYSRKLCENKCNFPYGLAVKYDRIRFPYGIFDGDTDDLPRIVVETCKEPQVLFVDRVCVADYSPVSEGAVRRSTPNVKIGYAILRASVAVSDSGSSSIPTQASTAFPPVPRVPDPAEAGAAAPENHANAAAAQSRAAFEESAARLHFLATDGRQPASLLPTVTREHAGIGLAILVAVALLAPLLLLYHRLRRDRVLEHELRNRLYKAICEAPGVHERALAARLAIKRQLVAYHAKYLAYAGFITIRSFSGQKCMFQNDGRFRGVEQRVLSVLRRGRTSDLLAELASSDDLGQRELATRLGMHESSVGWHLKRLESLGLVHVDRFSGVKLASLDEYAAPIVKARL